MLQEEDHSSQLPVEHLELGMHLEIFATQWCYIMYLHVCTQWQSAVNRPEMCLEKKRFMGRVHFDRLRESIP